jgi:hypothetical protein
MVTTETVATFTAKHGGPALRLNRKGERFTLADGASFYPTGYGPICFCDPPAEPLDRWQVVLSWRRRRLEQAEGALVVFERPPPTGGYGWQAGTYTWNPEDLGPPPVGAGGLLDREAGLARLRELVAERRAAVDEAAQELQRVSPKALNPLW